MKLNSTRQDVKFKLMIVFSQKISDKTSIITLEEYNKQEIDYNESILKTLTKLYQKIETIESINSMKFNKQIKRLQEKEYGLDQIFEKKVISFKQKNLKNKLFN